MPLKLTKAEQDKWLHEDIPHRIRAMFASTAELGARHPGGEPTWPDDVVKRCWTDCVWEGRLSALRFLCEFLGVKHSGSRPEAARDHPDQACITDLPNGATIPLTSPEAKVLADAWRACTKGSVHPTHNSNHPPINDGERSKAFKIILEHLTRTIYRSEPDWLKNWVLTPSPSHDNQ